MNKALKEHIEEIIQVVYRNGVIDGKQGTQMLAQDIVISETVRDLLALITAREQQIFKHLKKEHEVLCLHDDEDIFAIQLIREGEDKDE